LNEIKSLRAKERFLFRNHTWDFLFTIPTLQDILTLVKAKEKELNRQIGIYIETKHPAYYRSIGLPLEEELVRILTDNGYTTENDLVIIESFESNLKYLRKLTKLTLVQLVSGSEGDKRQYDTGRRWAEITSPSGLEEIATYANGVAPHKSCIFEIEAPGQTPTKTSFVEDAHKHELVIHVWTFRQERGNFEPNEKRMFGTLEEEMSAYLEAGIDGMFTDQPDIGVKIRNQIFSSFPLHTEVSTLYVVIAFTIAALLLMAKLSNSRIRHDDKTEAQPKAVGVSKKNERSNLK